MQVFGLKEGQSVKFGDEIEVMVVRIDGDKIRLGVKAPQAVPVHREEIQKLLHEELPSRRNLKSNA